MELVSYSAEPEEFFLEPVQYVFRDDDLENAISFVPTVPHGCEAERIYGDLFDCRIRDIDYESAPVPIGSDAELKLIEKLQKFADANKSQAEQESLLYGKFPRMDGEQVGWKQLLWFIAALKRRRENSVERGFTR